MKRVLAIGDLHCGHKTGLTPPGWPVRSEWQADTEYLWRTFDRYLKQAGPIDVLILNGDAIDGNGKRSGGIEQTEVDYDRQCDMAVEVIRHIGAEAIFLTYGTPYHVCNNGSQEEKKIADKVGGVISGHHFLDIEGVIFDVKHKIGSSGIPHGRASALMKAILWNQRQAQEGIQPRADIILRSHVHYHVYAGDGETLAMTLPALQGAGSKYGEEQCEGIVDFGMVLFEVENGSYTWEAFSERENGRTVALTV